MKKLLEVKAKFKLRTQINKDLLLNDLVMSAYDICKRVTNTSVAVKTVYLPISNLNTVEMPHDYVVYNKVGVHFKGQLWTLTVNERLLPPKPTRSSCGITTTEAAEGTGSSEINERWLFLPHYNKEGVFVGQMYGLGGGWNSQGYFKEDKINRRFIVDGVRTNEIILEYLSNEVSLDTLVPEHLVEPIIAYMKYLFELNSPMPVASRIQIANAHYDSQIKLARMVENPVRIDEYLDALYENQHLSVKG